MSQQRVLWLLVALSAFGAIEAFAVRSGSAWERTIALGWAALIGGPFFLMALHGRISNRAETAWKAIAGWAVVAAVGGASAELIKLLLRSREGSSDQLSSIIALYSGLTVLCMLSAFLALRVAHPASRVWTRRLAPLALIGILPFGENVLTTSLLACEILCVASLLGFERPWKTWIRATGMTIVLFAGVVGLMRLVVGRIPTVRGDAGVLVFGPIIAAVLVVFCVVLIRGGRYGAFDVPQPIAEE